MDKKKGIIYTIISASLFGLTPLIVQFAKGPDGFTAESLVLMRNVFVVPVLLIIIFIKKLNLKLAVPTLFKAFLVGIFGMTATALLLYKAYDDLGVGAVTVIHFLYPVFVAVAGLIIFKEKIPKVKAIVLAVATVGMVFFLNINPPEGGNLVLGLIFTVLSAVTYGFYMMGVERFKLSSVNSYVLTFYLSLFSAIVLLIYTIATKTFNVIDVARVAPHKFTYAFIIAMGTSFLAVYTLQLGIKYIGASTAAIFCMFEPVTAFIGGAIVFSDEEPVTLMKIIGTVIILGSVTMLTVIDKINEKKENKA